MKTAILFGATGFVGGFLLEELLNNAFYEKVIVVTRKELKRDHPKLVKLIGDFKSLPSLKEKLVGDDVFIALGTTKANTPDQKEYYQVDHDYPVLAAKLAKENGASSVSLVSAVGANEKSSLFYVRTKGEVERDIIALGFKYTHLFRPSMIMGQRQEFRRLEKAVMGIWKVLSPVLVGGLSEYKGIEGRDIALAMVREANKTTDKVKVYHWKEMMF